MSTQFFLAYESGTQESVNVPIWIIVGLQQRDRQGSRNFNSDTFYRPSVASAQCIIGTEKYPDAGILLNHNDDGYSQGYGQFKEAFRALTKYDLPQPYVSDNFFISSNKDDDFGYDLYVFDIPYQKNLKSAQPIKVEFFFSMV